MADFGGIEIETPQEVLARIREQTSRARNSNNVAVRRQATVNTAINAVFGSSEERTARRVQDAIQESQRTFQEDDQDGDIRNEINRLKSMRDAVQSIDPQTSSQINTRILELAVADEEQSRLRQDFSIRQFDAAQDIAASKSKMQADRDAISLRERRLNLDSIRLNKPSDTFLVAVDADGKESTFRADDERLDAEGMVVLGTADKVFTARQRAAKAARKRGDVVSGSSKFSDSALATFEDLAEKSAGLAEIAKFDFSQTGPVEGRIDAFFEFFGAETDTTRFNVLAGKLKLSAQSALKGVPSDKDQSILDDTLPNRNLNDEVNRARTKLQIEAAQAGVRYKISEAMAVQGRIPLSLVSAARTLGVEPATVGTVAEELRRVNSVLDRAEVIQVAGNGLGDGTVDPTPAQEVSRLVSDRVEEASKPLVTTPSGITIQ